MKSMLQHHFLPFFLLCVFSTAASAQTPDDPLWEKALQIHDEAIVMDAHAHPHLFSVPQPSPLNLGQKTGESQIDFPTMKEGGLDAVFMALPLRGEARDLTDCRDAPGGKSHHLIKAKDLWPISKLKTSIKSVSFSTFS